MDPSSQLPSVEPIRGPAAGAPSVVQTVPENSTADVVVYAQLYEFGIREAVTNRM